MRGSSAFLLIRNERHAGSSGLRANQESLPHYGAVPEGGAGRGVGGGCVYVRGMRYICAGDIMSLLEGDGGQNKSADRA